MMKMFGFCSAMSWLWSFLFVWLTLINKIQICNGKYVLDANNVISKEITCWTCPNKSSNSECNSWAPDIPCPKNHTVCQTVHRIHKQTGQTLNVDKKCAIPSMCERNHVGCKDTGKHNEMECISCCDTPYCNEEIPVDIPSAINLSSLQENSNSNGSTMTAASVVLNIILTVFSTWQVR